VVRGLDTCGFVRVRTASLVASGVFVPGFLKIGCGGEHGGGGWSCLESGDGGGLVGLVTFVDSLILLPRMSCSHNVNISVHQFGEY
jgi:hypothetical protein